MIANLSRFSLKAAVPNWDEQTLVGEKMTVNTAAPGLLSPENFASIAAYVAAVKVLTDPAAHHDDAGMADEHAALFALVPRNQATHVAVKNGSWFDPATWSDGQIPSAGARVLIPEAISVNYDGVSDASLFTVRVDGKLLFATDHDTRMVIDTLVVAKTGLLQIGSSDHPVQDGVTANIVIADNGPIDVNWDPLLLSRGVISHGSTDIHGQEKTSFLKLALDPVAGSTMLHLAEDAAQNGWHVGDTIVVTGTHIAPQQVNGNWVDIGSQDEVRTIKGIYGSTIVLDKALTYNHDSPRADLKAYVADYTRNVVIETEHASELPVSQRGHVMFMHSPSVNIEYAEFSELGRTDKSVRALDAQTIDGITSDTNIKGRYALHLHETGVEPGSPQTVIKGNAIWGSPGWGIVQHASRADIENNATFNTFGAAYVAETGDETGLWHNNIAIQAHGIGAGSWVDKNKADVAAFDLARSGVGFYFQGRMIEVTDNVAAGVNEGFVYMVRGSPATIDAENLAQPEILHGLPSSPIGSAPIQNFTDNEVLAAAFGFMVTKADPAQHHDVRSVINGFTAWETDVGVHLEYTAHYTFLDTDLIGPDVGRNFKPQGSNGIELGTNTYDIVFNRSNIENYKDAVFLAKTLAGDPSRSISPTDLNYVFIDLKTNDMKNGPIKNFDPAIDQLMVSSELKSGPASLTMTSSQIPVWDFAYPHGRAVHLDGVKTDSIGTINYANGSETLTIGMRQMAGLLSDQGYYTTDDGRKIVMLEEYYADRATGEIFKTSIPIQIAANVPLLQSQWYMLERDAISLGRIDLKAAAPTAVADAALTAIDTSVVIDVLHNDVDRNDQVMTVDGTTQPTHGTVTENLDGTLTYTPDNDFIGVETFKYWVTDQNGKFDDGVVTVRVGFPDGPPPQIAHPEERLPGDIPTVGGSPPMVTGQPNNGPPVHVPTVAEASAQDSFATPPVVHPEDKPTLTSKYSHVQLDHHQYNRSFDVLGQSYLVGDSNTAAAEALKVFDLTSQAYGPLSALSLAYEESFGDSGAASKFGSTGDQLAWKQDTVAEGDGRFLAGRTFGSHDEGLLDAKGSPIFENADNTFVFKDFRNPDLTPIHNSETGCLPDIEHPNLAASGFIFT